METKILKIDPRELKLLEVNARFMKSDEFSKLVNNIKRDGCLTQLPFCCRDPKEPDKYLVLSGNHRVKASIVAELEEIEVQVAVGKLSKDEMIAIQLSHNAISGQDDMAILKELYSAIDDIAMKDYCGLNDETLQLLEKIDSDSIGSVGLDYQIINLLFLPEEVKEMKKILKLVKTEIEANPTLLANFKDYDAFMKILSDVSKGALVKNTALSFMTLMRLAEKHIEDVKEIWMKHARPKDFVPISSVIGRTDIPSDEARKLDKVVEKMISRREIEKSSKFKAIQVLCDMYLGEKTTTHDSKEKTSSKKTSDRKNIENNKEVKKSNTARSKTKKKAE